MTMLSIMSWTSGCATVSGNYCDYAVPIWFTDHAEKAATPALIKRQILDHNKTILTLCQ